LCLCRGWKDHKQNMQNISLRLSQVTFTGVLQINLDAFSVVVPLQKLTAVADPILLRWSVHIYKNPSGFLQVTKWSLLMVCFDILNICHSTMLTTRRAPSCTNNMHAQL
jgi:hypothetical protein